MWVSWHPTDPKKSQCIDQCIQIHQIYVNKHGYAINIKFEVSLHFSLIWPTVPPPGMWMELDVEKTGLPLTKITTFTMMMPSQPAQRSKQFLKIWMKWRSKSNLVQKVTIRKIICEQGTCQTDRVAPEHTLGGIASICFRFHFQQTLRMHTQECQPKWSKIKNNLTFFKEFWWIS